jgi:uncharacterized protein
MDLQRFVDVGEFLDVAGHFLVAREAEHQLILGICGTLRDDPDAYPRAPYLATVSADGRVVAAAIQTPPFRLVLSEVDDRRAIDLLVEDTVERDLPGVFGPVDVVRMFIDAWIRRGGRPAAIEQHERSYQLTAVRPGRPTAGGWRVAGLDDRPIVLTWIEAFMLEAFGDVDQEEVQTRTDRWLAGSERTLYLWENDGPVSLCGVGYPTPNGIRVGPVYTPPDERGKGYASALVAAVSQAELDAGRRYCFLFTDLANPTSNHIYQAIGYEPVRDVDLWVFERPA